MRREISAGGVIVRTDGDRRWLAVIRPQGKRAGVWALPKGHIELGEPADVAAVREAQEETGLATTVVTRVGESRYRYRWEGQTVSKVVVFFLLRPIGGTLGAISPEMEREVAEAAWIPLDEAERRLAYKGERQIARRAIDLLEDDSAD
jgi:8-oxo-dGTP pyrophosphatase MutT (NUDIX family)